MELLRQHVHPQFTWAEGHIGSAHIHGALDAICSKLLEYVAACHYSATWHACALAIASVCDAV